MGYRMNTPGQVKGTNTSCLNNCFIDQINAEVIRRKLSRKEFSKIIGTSQPYASKILLGKTSVSMDYAQRIMDKMGMTYELTITNE